MLSKTGNFTSNISTSSNFFSLLKRSTSLPIEMLLYWCQNNSPVTLRVFSSVRLDRAVIPSGLRFVLGKVRLVSCWAKLPKEELLKSANQHGDRSILVRLFPTSFNTFIILSVLACSRLTKVTGLPSLTSLYSPVMTISKRHVHRLTWFLQASVLFLTFSYVNVSFFQRRGSRAKSLKRRQVSDTFTRSTGLSCPVDLVNVSETC